MPKDDDDSNWSNDSMSLLQDVPSDPPSAQPPPIVEPGGVEDAVAVVEESEVDESGIEDRENRPPPLNFVPETPANVKVSARLQYLSIV